MKNSKKLISMILSLAMVLSLISVGSITAFAEFCEDCDGNGFTLCETCEGAGFLMCEACEGAGFLMCEACEGEGCDDCDEGLIRCSDCDEGLIDCSDCDEGIIPCETCYGSGYEPTTITIGECEVILIGGTSGDWSHDEEVIETWCSCCCSDESQITIFVEDGVIDQGEDRYYFSSLDDDMTLECPYCGAKAIIKLPPATPIAACTAHPKAKHTKVDTSSGKEIEDPMFGGTITSYDGYWFQYADKPAVPGGLSTYTVAEGYKDKIGDYEWWYESNGQGGYLPCEATGHHGHIHDWVTSAKGATLSAYCKETKDNEVCTCQGSENAVSITLTVNTPVYEMGADTSTITYDMEDGEGTLSTEDIGEPVETPIGLLYTDIISKTSGASYNDAMAFVDALNDAKYNGYKWALGDPMMLLMMGINTADLEPGSVTDVWIYNMALEPAEGEGYCQALDAQTIEEAKPANTVDESMGFFLCANATKIATVGGDDPEETMNWAMATYSIPEIMYVGRNGTVYAESEVSPTKAGKYTAKISFGKPATTASVDFEILKQGSKPTPIPIGTGSGGVKKYTVKIDTNGGNTLKNVSVRVGQKIGSIETPKKDGFVFDGWFSDKELTKPFNADDKITKSTTLYAGWKVDPVRQIILTIGKKEAAVFTKEKVNDVAPKIVKDRTMLPIRFVAEALDAKVDWDSEKELVTISNENLKIEITIGKDIAFVNGKEIKLDSPAFIENDRTYMPIRFVAENLGADVEWVGATQQVFITKKLQ